LRQQGVSDGRIATAGRESVDVDGGVVGPIGAPGLESVPGGSRRVRVVSYVRPSSFRSGLNALSRLINKPLGGMGEDAVNTNS
jgi:hypothetical protein